MTITEQIDSYISGITDWRGEILLQLRNIIHEADEEIVEEWKWDVPVFTHKTMVCAISAFKDHVKINFFKGAAVSDPHKLFNGGLESKKHRSIDFTKDDSIKKEELRALIKEAVSLNIS